MIITPFDTGWFQSADGCGGRFYVDDNQGNPPIALSVWDDDAWSAAAVYVSITPDQAKDIGNALLRAATEATA